MSQMNARYWATELDIVYLYLSLKCKIEQLRLIFFVLSFS